MRKLPSYVSAVFTGADLLIISLSLTVDIARGGTVCRLSAAQLADTRRAFVPEAGDARFDLDLKVRAGHGEDDVLLPCIVEPLHLQRALDSLKRRQIEASLPAPADGDTELDMAAVATTIHHLEELL